MPLRRKSDVSTSVRPNHVCGVCQWVVDATVQPGASHTCRSCGSVFHAECWRENRGCSAYGCAQVGALDQPDVPVIGNEVLAAHEQVGPADLAQQLGASPSQDELALLSAGIVGSLLGVISFGAPALVVAVVAVLYLRRHGRRSRVPLLVATTAMSLLAAIGGVFVSIVWWFPGALTW